MNLKDPRKTESGMRITIILDNENIRSLRDLQSKIILDNAKNVSFSRVINRIIKIGLKNFKKKEVKF